MDKIKYPRPIDLAPFAENNTHPSAKYGLPGDVAYCKKCVISNQRPNSAVEYKHTKDSKKVTIHFDEEGICDACRFAERKHHGIDWVEREKRLRELCDKHRKHVCHRPDVYDRRCRSFKFRCVYL